MASPAHCFYCFECLSASFEGTEAPSLSLVEDLWEEYEAFKELPLNSASRTDAGEIESEEWEGLPDKARDQGDENDPDTKGDEAVDQQATADRSNPVKLPSISRLQGLPSPGSSQSSTPSVLSTTSSLSTLTATTSLTSQSSKSTPISLSNQSYSAVARTSDINYPLFVTWNVIGRDGHKHLRGCIGTFEPQDLPSGLKSYALSSAFGDTRFSPVPASLMPSLSCSLTLLSSFETCSHAMDWVLGTHGIRISFTHRGRRYGATYLPDVPVEQGWTKEDTVESLMRKAGWDVVPVYSSVARRFLRSNANSEHNTKKPWEEVSDFKTVRYQGLKASATHAQWQEWRKWVASSPDRLKLLGTGF
ncbi:hypothetical protein D8B26_001332 [Coccidioides posadasii str. Silveira]|uniref:Uncharacterized protein n=3 Tax=Coccidioides posadasii TaxID=199306 RepID=E9D9U7_COCPS|nr:hypothetical protein CPC735_046190 [Coccidioides posadasii C735 delta SOWgp]EER23249.1 hypothetical protein CPC735_046190 [Coccidioides posadasii C735 delta SOWgp]EFW16678.1 hypothetical protein CPSG_06637 [Coccidioides posadasii str. Silveira]KMM64556.1 hypothetical protein CPAG_00908 [Coccidioides posadasii RMSCC 3488]QVM06627.1 hypothetical protein D8B26_001332 [Coccidioides posadasii str. Silveira]|eukprot:XP_003065394.1 hypothetical protein CPC735_046190 [Coccidioides posadasii C735 delta SOWgp]